MERFVICNNASCHFVLDRRVNGKSPDGAQLILRKCPACGGDWSSICPSCAKSLAVKLVAGLPHSVCCNRKQVANVRAAEFPRSSSLTAPDLGRSRASQAIQM